MIKKIAVFAAAAITAAALPAAGTAAAAKEWTASTTTEFVSNDVGDLFTVTPHEIDIGNCIIVAMYKDGRFVDWWVGSYTNAMQENGTVPIYSEDASYATGAYNSAVVFVWDSAENMHRITDVEKVKLGETESSYNEPGIADVGPSNPKGTLYFPEKNRLTETAAAGGHTILVAKPHSDGKFDSFNDLESGTDADYIIYIGQTTSETGYAANTAFYLKENAADGLYKVYIGKDGEKRIERFFYIGLDPNAIDIKMTLNSSSDDTAGNKSNSYTAENVPANNEYRSVIMEIDGKYMGMPIETMTSGDGQVSLSVLINDIPKDVTIGGVWLSTRSVTDLGDGSVELTAEDVNLPSQTE